MTEFVMFERADELDEAVLAAVMNRRGLSEETVNLMISVEKFMRSDAKTAKRECDDLEEANRIYYKLYNHLGKFNHCGMRVKAHKSGRIIYLVKEVDDAV